MRGPCRWFVVALMGCVGLSLSGQPHRADATKPAPTSGPLSPQDERRTFHIAKGFRVELVACEPNVVDPVAMAFDENGRIYVAEMRGYPNKGVATGHITSGSIKLLEDRDGDGFYEHCTTFADGLRFPTSVMPWKGGLLTAVAPDIVYLEDTDGAGRADRKRTLYSDFNLYNVQQLVNSLQWGMDNWVYGCAGYNGGNVRSADRPERPPVTLTGRNIRFHPDQPGSLEATSGGGQFGLAPDEWEQWFTATNNQHLRHVILPDHYLRRNPALVVGETTLDIPDHGAACKLFRISPFEEWRVERTRRRREGADAQRFPSTELIPGGYVTSGCSPVVYTDRLFPAEYRGNTFVCDPANNLIHRDKLVPHGATFVAERADPDREFLASTDNWFRPVNLVLGPEGAIYVLDFYREVIETPLSLPEDIKKRLNLESRGRGRIWRIVPEGTPPLVRPALGKASTEALVGALAGETLWTRLTAQRLLVERQDRAAVKPLIDLARHGDYPPARAHALWTLDGLKALPDDLLREALKDSAWGVREQALRLAERRLASQSLRAAVMALADDPVARVRFQLAFTLGEIDTPEAVSALSRIARRDVEDPWTQMAVLSSASRTAPQLLEMLVHAPDFLRVSSPLELQFLHRLASLVGAQAQDTSLVRALELLMQQTKPPATWKRAILEGLGEGRQNSPRPMARLWQRGAPEVRAALERVRPFFAQAARTVRAERSAPDERLAAVKLLAYGPFILAAPPLQELLGPQTANDLRLAAVRSLSLHDDQQVASLLLQPWNSYSPAARREVLEALFARPDRVAQLLDAIERRQVLPGQIEPARLDRLRKQSDPALRRRAQSLLAGQEASPRRRVIEDYRVALDLKSDPARGKAVFKKNCTTCHRLEEEGVEVGPDLLSALRTKTREGLLTDILDPSREVDPRYINYLVTNKAGRLFTGMIAAETASSITLRRAERAEDTLLRAQIEDIQATAQSLMPDGLEMQLSKQDIADVIAYLQVVAVPK